MRQSKAADLATVSRISAVPAILQVVSEFTGMGFAAVARVTEDTWTACAVLDKLGFGLKPGGELDLNTTLCNEIQGSHQPIVIDHVAEDPVYCLHHTPLLYQFQSYISYPVFRADGSFFGTLCALDPKPAKLKGTAIEAMMVSFARLLSIQIEYEESQQRIEADLAAEREVSELREQFIAVLGHDLRNPLFAINAGAEILLRQPLDNRSQTVARHILTSGQRAARLVDDVLDFARGRLGNGIALSLDRCSHLDTSLRHVVAEIQSVHPERVIDSDIAPLPDFHCDPGRMGQLLSNLVANAITHGSHDTPVHVHGAVEHDTFVLQVINQGAPIPPDVQAQLFQPYARPATDAPQAGLGLGLYIASQIAIAHGGRLDVTSTRETGTVFTFCMPLQTA
jgi:signal transduction histidine kinase